MSKKFGFIFLCLIVALVGCSSKQADPSFTVDYSEYPSFAAFGVAHEMGLIDGAKGKQGPIEKRWNVDIVLELLDYDPCIQNFGAGKADASCQTNVDSVAPSVGRRTKAILALSTSVGADALIVDESIKSIEDLKGKPTRGLDKSVSQYTFVRNLELLGLNPKDYPFAAMDPAAAATAMIQGQPDINAIIVWEPFRRQVLKDRKGTRVLFSSDSIAEEVVDMVVVGEDVLAREGGDNFACALVDTIYAVNDLLADPKTRDETLVALGKKFSRLGLEDMKEVTTLVRFFKTPDEALAVLNSTKFREETMPRVVAFAISNGQIEKPIKFGFSSVDKDTQLNFETKYIERVRDLRTQRKS